jgi:hypothetical protein
VAASPSSVTPDVMIAVTSNSQGSLARGSARVGLSAPAARKARRISGVAWTPSAELRYGDWVLEGRRLGLICQASPWWIGDWLLYGTARWGEMYVEAARITSYDPKSLRTMRYVASRFHMSLRRDNLTWSHHALLASLDRDTQAFWLDRASEERFSVQDLRLELRGAQRGPFCHLVRDTCHGPRGVVQTR